MTAAAVKLNGDPDVVEGDAGEEVAGPALEQRRQQQRDAHQVLEERLGQVFRSMVQQRCLERCPPATLPCAPARVGPSRPRPNRDWADRRRNDGITGWWPLQRECVSTLAPHYEARMIVQRASMVQVWWYVHLQRSQERC